MKLRIPSLHTTLMLTAAYVSLENTLKAMEELAVEPDRSGGHFHVALSDVPERGGFPFIEPVPLLASFVGDVANEKLTKYAAFAREKAVRLHEHQAHWSSWESRDEKAERFGGGIRFLVPAEFFFPGYAGKHRVNCVGAFSGFPEKADEALMLDWAQMMETQGFQTEVLNIIGTSDNEIARHMLGM